MGHTSQIMSFEKCRITIIVDDVLLYGCTAGQLLSYFITVIDVIKHHCATLKLKRCEWFQKRNNFVGMDLEAGGTQPAHSRNEDFSKLEQPNKWGDLCILIRLFGLYSQFLPLYELEIRPCRYILSNQPQPGTISQNGDMELMQNL